MSLARLPLFPLGLVLFPGVSAPLHLFEPRYRQLLSDVKDTDRRFGIIRNIPGAPEHALPTGHIGCVAEITDIEMLPDGRSNIVVVGRERFAIEQVHRTEAPYLVADVAPLPDITDASPVMLAVLADDVAAHFGRVVRAVRTLNDAVATGPPTLPDSPAQLAWTIASMIDIELDQRQRLLAERSATARLAQINAVLKNALPDLELRAAMHAR